MRTLPTACCLLVAVFALDAGIARAQFRLSPPGRDRPFGGPFRMRFPTDNRPPTVSELLLNELLQWELKLTDEQIDRLEDVEAEVQQRQQAEAERLTQSRHELWQAQAALHRKMGREQREVTQSILTPPQRDRLRQIEIQLAGPAALADPAVRQALQLTGPQVEAVEKALRDIRTSYNEQSRRPRRVAAAAAGGAAPRRPSADLTQHVKELSQQALKKLEAQLSAEQKKRWAALVGEPSPTVQKWDWDLSRAHAVMGPFVRGESPIPPVSPNEIVERLRDELKLSEEQATRIGNLPGVIAEGHKEESKQFEKQERELGQAETAREARQASELDKALPAVLTPQQRRRLEQIQFQLRGLAAWDDPAVEKALKLTDEQKAALKKVRTEAQAKAREVIRQAFQERFGEAGGDFRKRQRLRERQAAAAYRAAQERAEAVLTPEQQKRWRELTGPPVRLRVEFAPLRR
jgi:hypothetical protein